MANNIITGHKLATAQSLAASFEMAEVIDIATLDRLFFNISTTGITDNTGEFFVQSRLIKDKNNFSEWSTLPLSPQAVLSDADAQLTIVLDPPPIGQIRVTFVAAGGTPDGTADVWVSGASIGGR